MFEPLTRELLKKYRDLVYRQYGIPFDGSKVEMLEMKLKKLAIRESYSAFYDRLTAGDRKATDELLRIITVGHTFFFREEAHLSYLVDDIRKKRISKPLIWCAASSTGEEPYSIVIFLLEHGITDFLVISTDINLKSLLAMHRGVYHINQFQNTAKEVLRRYFRKRDPFTWRIRPELREYLRIKRLNLQSEILFERNFDYILCRNVMIYFDEPGRLKVLKTLLGNLKPAGLLFVGHSEAMLTLPEQLKKEAPAVFRRIS